MADNLPFRQIHLDFHTSPHIRSVASQFDADTFIRTMLDAHVNSVTVFAKCHHGHLYYDTKHPARHPNLKRGFDLLAAQVDALHKHHIAAPLYVSVLCDEYAANEHPEWLALNPDGSPCGAGPLDGPWQRLDMASPYQDYLADQIDEVLRKFKPIDGLFVDICIDTPSCSKWSIDAMRKAQLDPEDETDRHRFARQLSHQYMARYNKMVAAAHRGRQVNVWYNSRPMVCLGEEKKFLHHIDIEALPTGQWDYSYFPLNVRFVRTLGLPYVGMTGRFHKSWADFGGLKPPAALMYECTQMLAHGAACSIGDQMHPRGTLDKPAYQLIADVYSHVEACEPWCQNAKPIAQIAVLRSLQGQVNYHPDLTGPEVGVVRLLQQLRLQFDFVGDTDEANLAGYNLVIVPDNVSVTGAIKTKLTSHVRAGGALLLAGQSAINEKGQPILKEMGVVAEGVSPYTTTYVRIAPDLCRSIAGFDHVMYETGLQLAPSHGAKVLARVVEPYFERSWKHFCSHFQSPPNKLSRYAAAIQQGRIITLAHPVFRAYAAHANIWIRNMVGASIDRLLPQPLLRCGGPSYLETTVTRQAKRTIVHLLSYCPQRRAPDLDIVEEATELHDLELSLKLDHAPGQVYTAPDHEQLNFEYAHGRTITTVPTVHGHQMIVFE